MALWNSDNQRELIEVKLTDTLKFGIEYCIEFYVSSVGGTGTDCIHLGFSPDSLRTNNGFLLAGVVPAISADTIITDTLNWNRIYGTYIANGDEIFIVIGNLLDNSFCQIDDASLGGSYYYVDNVSIYKCSDTLNLPDSNVVIIPNVFSPNNDDTNDIFRIIGAEGNTHMEIYNRWGEKIYFADGNNCYWDGWTNVGVQCPDGAYFYLITIEKKTYKGYVHLLR